MISVADEDFAVNPDRGIEVMDDEADLELLQLEALEDALMAAARAECFGFTVSAGNQCFAQAPAMMTIRDAVAGASAFVEQAALGWEGGWHDGIKVAPGWLPDGEIAVQTEWIGNTLEATYSAAVHLLSRRRETIISDRLSVQIFSDDYRLLRELGELEEAL